MSALPKGSTALFILVRWTPKCHFIKQKGKVDQQMQTVDLFFSRLIWKNRGAVLHQHKHRYHFAPEQEERLTVTWRSSCRLLTAQNWKFFDAWIGNVPWFSCCGNRKDFRCKVTEVRQTRTPNFSKCKHQIDEVFTRRAENVWVLF